MVQRADGVQGSGPLRPIDQRKPSSEEGKKPLAELNDGEQVDGRVVSKEGDVYLVRIRGQLLRARSDFMLDVGQKFSALFERGEGLPTLHLKAPGRDMFSGMSDLEKGIAGELLARGMSVDSGLLKELSSLLGRLGGGSEKLSAMMHLWARGLAVNQENMSAIMFFNELDPRRIAALWNRMREKMKSFWKKAAESGAGSEELMESLDEEEKMFVKAQRLLLTPPRKERGGGNEIVSLWMPIDSEEQGPLMAKLRIKTTDNPGGDPIFRVSFDMDTTRMGGVWGDIVAQSDRLLVSIVTEDGEAATDLRQALPELRSKLSELGWSIENIKAEKRKKPKRSDYRALDLKV